MSLSWQVTDNHAQMMRYPSTSLVQLLILLCLCVMGTTLHAQCDKADKLYVKARKLKGSNPSKALSMLEKAFSYCQSHEKVAYELADAAVEAGDHERLETVLHQLRDATGHIKTRAWLALAESAREHHRYADAISYYDQYLALDTNITARTVRARLDRRSSIYAMDAYQQAMDIEFHKLPDDINGGHTSEYLAIMPADESTLLYTRREAGRESAMTADVRGDSYGPSLPFLPSLDRFRTAATTRSPDGRTIALAIKGHPAGLGNFDLFYLEWNGSQWSPPRPFGPEINTPSWESQPCFGPDGRTLYFVSNRKGGEGGSDIWYTRRSVHGDWGPAINLGPTINTRYQDESPYVHRDQTRLYFRSDGHPGLGGFDLFVSTRDWEKGWSVPTNLGYPINSKGNDGSLFLRNDGQTAIIASDVDRTKKFAYEDQVTQGHIDLYSFIMPESLATSPLYALQMSVVDYTTQSPLVAQALVLRTDRSDTLYIRDTDVYGQVTLLIPQDTTYALSIQSEGYLPYFQRYKPRKDVSGIHSETVALVPLPDEASPPPPPVVLENILFVTGSSNLLPSSIDEIIQLKTFMTVHPDVRIKIRGHTDDVGQPADNLELSQRRAKVVHDELISRGIAANRISYEGLGETQPIADNDTPEGRANNRRTDFVVLR